VPDRSKAFDIEERLRRSLSGSAPEAFPTIGVRERIVYSVRARRRRRRRGIAGVAFVLVLVGGASAAAVSLQSARQPAEVSSAPSMHASSSASPSKVGKAPGAPLRASAHPDRGSVPANCGWISLEGNGHGGCYGSFRDLAGGNADQQGIATFGAAAPSATSERNEPAKATGAPSSSEPQLRSIGNDEVVAPVGLEVSIELPATKGYIWTAPAVVSSVNAVPGATSKTGTVRTAVSSSGGPDAGSYAIFESDGPARVMVAATAIATCGPSRTACGVPVREWSVILEFQGA